MYAVVRTHGFQYLVEKGDRIKIPALFGETGKPVEFEDILMLGDGDKTDFGRPLVKGSRVKGIVLKQGKSAKKIIYKFTRRENYRRKRGHRQDFTEVEITEIVK